MTTLQNPTGQPPSDPLSGSAREVLHELLACRGGDEANTRRSIERILSKICEFFGLQQAIISRSDTDSCLLEYVSGQAMEVRPGAQLPRAEVICGNVVEMDKPLWLPSIANSDFRDHPFRIKHGVECYVGGRLAVAGRVFGTLGLVGLKPRDKAFNADDALVLEAAIAQISLLLSLNEARQRFHLAITGANVGVWDWDIRADALYWSPRHHEILGITDPDHQPSADDYSARVHPDDLARVRESQREHLENHRPLDIEYRVCRGEEWVDIRARGQAIWDENGHAVRMAGSIEDITKLKLEREALAQSEARYELAVEGASVGLWDWDPVTGGLYWSPQLLTILGLDPETYQPSFENWSGTIHPEDIDDVLPALTRHLEEGSEYSVEYRIRHGSGHYIWVQTRGQATWNAAGEPLRMAGSLYEITDLKRAEEKLREQTAELERTNTELESFAMAASHDLQEPLRKIAAFGDILVDRYSDILDQQGREIIGIMVDGASRMQQLIVDLLAYSKSSNTEMVTTDVDLSILLQDVRLALGVQLEESRATLNGHNLPIVPGDAGLLRQLFQNLISNALKYRGDAEPYIEITAELEADKNNWLLVFKDNGIGFEAKYSKRIFEIFERLHTRKEFSGTGIGLALCHRIVARHHGEIWAKGDVGRGASFHIRLPAGSVTKFPHSG
jgi:PAS domain S-box-containing protein